MRKNLYPPIKINRFASRVAVLIDEPYEPVSKTIKAMLILMAEMKPKEISMLLARYKKFRGNVPRNVNVIHE